MNTILIVDDAVFMREVIRAILNDGGYENLIEAEDGETAIQKYAHEKPELVLLDITMPRMDGVEALQKIKALNPEAKVVMCSAIGQERQMIRALQLGAADYIVKPFRPDVMLRIIDKVLRA